MDYLGIQVDKQKNEVRGKDTIISTEQSTTTVMTVTTDEELVIAMDTVRLS
jgi:acetate kinase